MAARELILGSLEQIEARFPKLDDSQITALEGFGQQRDAQPREVILERGDLHHGIFVIPVSYTHLDVYKRQPLKVISPDLQALSFTIDNGVKVFQLTAEPVKRKIAPWKRCV